ncbi:hypothetical protein C8R44DRAFT_731982 [Mycena epipterygia]|nr:hypothetical protein C8R44DRAFT_731982 [Mycena epipterygia]
MESRFREFGPRAQDWRQLNMGVREECGQHGLGASGANRSELLKRGRETSRGFQGYEQGEGRCRGLQVDLGLEPVEGIVSGSLASRGVYPETLGTEWNAGADAIGAVIKIEIFEEDLKKVKKEDSAGFNEFGC